MWWLKSQFTNSTDFAAYVSCTHRGCDMGMRMPGMGQCMGMATQYNCVAPKPPRRHTVPSELPLPPRRPLGIGRGPPARLREVLSHCICGPRCAAGRACTQNTSKSQRAAGPALRNAFHAVVSGLCRRLHPRAGPRGSSNKTQCCRHDTLYPWINVGPRGTYQPPPPPHTHTPHTLL